MEAKELKIEVPKGYEVDKKNSTFEKIVFKPIDTKPRSWKEYCESESGFDGSGIDWNIDGGIQTTGLHHRGKAIVPTHLAQSFIAMMQLMSLRQEWIGDWEPDWNNEEIIKWCIDYRKNKICVYDYCSTSHSLSFPTKEMADEFLNCFKDLLEQAKILL